MFERFTDRARRVVVLAQEEARRLNHNYIGTEHILLGLIQEGEGHAAKALEELNINIDSVRSEVVEIIGEGQQSPSGHIPFTPRAKKVLELNENQICNELDSQMALDMGLVTFSFDDIDWEDEVRIFLEERSSFSPDSMTGLEANLIFAGPETMETKIFGRLTAWQNWIFQRPNAVGEEGALKKYGSGNRSKFNWERV